MDAIAHPAAAGAWSHVAALGAALATAISPCSRSFGAEVSLPVRSLELKRIAAAPDVYVIFVQACLESDPAITFHESLRTKETVHYVDIAVRAHDLTHRRPRKS